MRLVHTAAVLALLFPVSAPAADYAAGVKSRIVLKTTVTASGEKIRYPVTDRPQVTAAEVEIAPGAVTGSHEHPGPVYAWVISGSLTIEAAGGATKTYHAGDPIVEMTGVPHNGRNTGSVPARLLVFYLGVEGMPVTTKSGN
jgi:quercetin dioxygenase-like cupin family protein